MPVTPRPASTVVLMDEMSRVYLTKRPKTMKFFGGFYVFPGGAVEKSDYEFERQNIRNGKETFDQAYYVAAARELFEEVGVLLGSKEDGLTVFLETEMEMEYRRQLMNGDLSFLEIINNEGLELNLSSLTYIGSLTTPKESPIRFETKFFLTQLPQGQNPKPDVNEIDEGVWFSPEEALAQYQSKKIRIAPPTILTLKAIIDHQNGLPLTLPDLEDLNLEDIIALRF